MDFLSVSIMTRMRCKNCDRLEQRIIRLEKLVAELQKRLEVYDNSNKAPLHRRELREIVVQRKISGLRSLDGAHSLEVI